LAKICCRKTNQDKPKNTIPTLENFYQGIAETHLVMATKESTAESYESSFVYTFCRNWAN
jgi:hypothetical protein